ncbi:MAG: SEC-C metal-binding domain-containing protein [Desulforhopalus sp.]
MGKIGRNEKCPCRSGKKFKQCCALKPQAGNAHPSQRQAMRVTLVSSVKDLQNDAAAKRTLCRDLGVFFFFSTAKGDGWLLEMTQCDCVQVAKDGEPLEVAIDENPETIEINWSHTYRLHNKRLQLTAYSDKSVQVLDDAPSRELNAAMRRVRKKFSREQLEKVHLPSRHSSDSP